MNGKVDKIDVKEAVKLIQESKGKFITVSFTKRTNNELRTMNCRVGVIKGLKNGKKKRSRRTGLITVYDMGEKDYRNINSSGLRSLKINGKRYSVVE